MIRVGDRVCPFIGVGLGVGCGVGSAVGCVLGLLGASLGAGVGDRVCLVGLCVVGLEVGDTDGTYVTFVGLAVGDLDGREEGERVGGVDG